MKSFITVMLFVLFGQVYADSWEYHEKVDPMTDKKTIYTSVNESQSGTEFVIGQPSNTKVNVQLHIHSPYPDFIPNATAIFVRVDKNKVRKYEISIFGAGTLRQDTGSVYFQVPYDDGFLNELMNGSVMYIRYPGAENLYSAKMYTLKFGLDGSTDALSKLLPDGIAVK